ncbi:MAG: hypothetical protein RXR01_08225 [Thermoproteus sp.]
MRIAGLELSKAKSIFSTNSVYFEHSDTSPAFKQLIRYDGTVLIQLSEQWRTLIYFLSNMKKKVERAMPSVVEDEGTNRVLDISYERLLHDQEFENKTTTAVAFEPCVMCGHRLVEASYKIVTPLTTDIIIILIESAKKEGIVGPPFLMLQYIP